MKKRLYQIISSSIAVIATSVFIFILINRNIMPTKYINILSTILIPIILLLILWMLTTKHLEVKISISIIFAMLMLGYGIGIVYYEKVNSFIGKINNHVEYQTENYSLMVLNSSSSEIVSYNKKTIGIMSTNDTSSNTIEQELRKEIDFYITEDTTFGTLCISLLNKEIDALLIEQGYIDILEESDSEFLKEVKVIWTKEIKVPVKNISKQASVSTEPFIVFVSGIDTFGSISNVSRSDVNIIMVVNPVTYKILMIHIPRDYYLTFADKNYKDKLTNTGILGINTTIKTVENYFDLDINYYIKVNFNSLVSLVDILGGIEVYSEYEYTTSRKETQIKKGTNFLNGKQALAFARERKALPGGDRDRGVNEERVLTAIINKMTSPTLITKFSNTLDVLGNSFVTNIGETEVKKFINFELDRLPSWKIETITVNGSDLWLEYTPFSYGVKAYVMNPDTKTVELAKTKINEYLK